jgi:hypothetical protein
MRGLWILALPMLLGAGERVQQRLEIRKYRLELHVPDQNGIYFTAWSNADGILGEVITDHDGADGQTVVYRRRLVWLDRCTWDATETLKPTAADHYKYEYRETPVSCPPGVTANTAAATPRDGEVSVHLLDKDKPLTPLFAWAHGWDKPRN